jgi:hypothetical protein
MLDAEKELCGYVKKGEEDEEEEEQQRFSVASRGVATRRVIHLFSGKNLVSEVLLLSLVCIEELVISFVWFPYFVIIIGTTSIIILWFGSLGERTAP